MQALDGVQDAISLDHYMKLRECVPDGGGGSTLAEMILHAKAWKRDDMLIRANSDLHTD